jgi:transposase-like protein
MSEWTSELKEEVVAAYEERNPTPDNSTDIVMELAEEYDKTPNAVRAILVKAGVYVKKAPAAKPSNKKEGGSTRVSKADSIQSLKDAISAAGAEVDDEILDKLTGKAAIYLAGVIATVTNG